MPTFFLMCCRRWSACSSSVPTVSWIPFLSAGVQENSGCFGGVTALVMMFGAVGDMLGTGAAGIIRPVERAATCGWPAQPRQHAGLAGIVHLPDDDCRQMFLTDILRLFGATDELMPNAVRYSRILIYGNLAYMLVTGVLAVIRNDGRPVLSMADGRRTAAEHRNGLCFHFFRSAAA